jgi:hypothetical protein
MTQFARQGPRTVQNSLKATNGFVACNWLGTCGEVWRVKLRGTESFLRKCESPKWTSFLLFEDSQETLPYSQHLATEPHSK